MPWTITKRSTRSSDTIKNFNIYTLYNVRPPLQHENSPRNCFADNDKLISFAITTHTDNFFYEHDEL